MDSLLEKKLKDITIDELMQFIKLINGNKKKVVNVDFESYINEKYQHGGFYFHYIKFSDIYQTMCDKFGDGVSKKQLSNTLKQLGFTSKVKAIKGGSTARFYYMVAKCTDNE